MQSITFIQCSIASDAIFLYQLIHVFLFLSNYSIQLKEAFFLWRLVLKMTMLIIEGRNKCSEKGCANRMGKKIDISLELTV